MPELVPPSAPSGRSVLVVEDEYLAADDLRMGLEDAGVTVLGPAATVAAAMAMLEAGPAPDAAILDIRLGEETVFPVAARLRAAGVPFIFATGYDARSVPDAYRAVPRCEKPYDTGRCLRLLLGPSAA